MTKLPIGPPHEFYQFGEDRFPERASLYNIKKSVSTLPIMVFLSSLYSYSTRKEIWPPIFEKYPLWIYITLLLYYYDLRQSLRVVKVGMELAVKPKLELKLAST